MLRSLRLSRRWDVPAAVSSNTGMIEMMLALGSGASLSTSDRIFITEMPEKIGTQLRSVLECVNEIVRSPL